MLQDLLPRNRSDTQMDIFLIPILNYLRVYTQECRVYINNMRCVLFSLPPMPDELYSADTIQKSHQNLLELANEPRTHFNKREAVEALFEAIEKALVNHTYEEVAKRLESSGIEIAHSSLKQYVLQIRRQKGNKKKAGGNTVKKSGTSQGTSNPKLVGKEPRTGKESSKKEKAPLPENEDDIKLAY